MEENQNIMEQNNQVEENQNYQATTTTVLMNLRKGQIGSLKGKIKIEYYDSVFDNADRREEYVPIIGHVVGSNYFCYGIRIYADYASFNIFCPNEGKIYTCDVIDKIATVVRVFDANAADKFALRGFWANVRGQYDQMQEVDAHKLGIELGVQHNSGEGNDVNTCFVGFYGEGNNYLDEMHNDLIDDLLYVWTTVIVNYIAKFNLNISYLTSNKKVLKGFNKCGSIDDMRNTIFNNASFDEIYEMYQLVKQRLEQEQVFEGFNEDWVDLVEFETLFDDQYGLEY